MSALTAADLAQLRAHGIDPGEAERQLRFFAQPPPPIDLVRPCTGGDGVVRLDAEARSRLPRLWRRAAGDGRLTKFVPASGAATRLFRSLSWYLAGQRGAGREDLTRLARSGSSEAAEVLLLLDAWNDLPFAERLRTALRGRGDDADRLLAAERYAPLFSGLLGDDGLGWGGRPKALIDFHRYPEGARTAFEEHFVEAAEYLALEGGACAVHFTIPPAHEEEFRRQFTEFAPRLESRTGVRLRLRLSAQDPATDTVAVDPDNRPFRRDDGRLLLRPGGHGALLGNLARLGADLLYVKNIDNVAHDSLMPVTARWKRLLGGLLVELQEQVFELQAALERGQTDAEVRALGLLDERFAVEPPTGLAADADRRRRWLRDRLHRPIRVCGVVMTEGQVGGGPFWVRGSDGGVYGQIVESAQIDRELPQHRAAIEGATHFNPVDLVCGLRDRHGEPLDLPRWVDPDAAFITRKLHGTRPLRALEHPGLWNGSMAGWNTVFVEVPAETFNPVKTVADLLKPGHRPGARVSGSSPLVGPSEHP